VLGALILSGHARVSFYSRWFSGHKTASGEHYDPHKHTAANRSLPMGSCILITNPRNNRSDVVRVNDRGPFVRGRLFDLSEAAAKSLGLHGVSLVRYQVVDKDKCK
jgi:rare lipoprotein A